MANTDSTNTSTHLIPSYKLPELEAAFKTDSWTSILNDSELLYTLADIFALDGVAEDVKNYLLRGASSTNKFNQNFWQTLDTLEKHNLIWQEKNFEGGLMHIHFLPELKEKLQTSMPHLFKPLEPQVRNDTFTFTIRKELVRRSSNETPEYHGFLKLHKNIHLEEGKEYSYAGWINDDGSIYIKIVPIEENIMLAPNRQNS